MFMNALFFFTVLILFIHNIHGAYFEGDLSNVDDGFKVFGVFAFGNAPDLKHVAGRMKIKLKSSTSGTANVVIYSDEEKSFPKIFDDSTGSYKSQLSCEQKISHAKNYDKNNGKIREWNGQATSVNFGTSNTFEGTYEIYQQSRPRFWYIGLANCDDPKHSLTSITYEVEFLNVLVDNSSWEEQFGFNINGVQTLFLTFFFIYFIYLGIHFYAVKGLNEQLSYVHPLVKMFTVLVVIEFLSIISYLVHYGTYVQDGVGVTGAYYIGEVLSTMAKLGFIALLMLVAKGWTISSEVLEGKKEVVGVIVFVLAVDVLLMIWEYAVRMPEAIYPPTALAVFQYMLITFYGVFALWYAKTISASWKDCQNEQKRKFFVLLGVVYTIWVLLIPFFAYLSLIISPWVSFVANQTLSLLLICSGFGIFTFLIWPSRATDYFSINVPHVAGLSTSGALDYARL